MGKQHCFNVPDINCHQVPKVECHDTKTQHCSPVPVKDCREKPRRRCALIPSIRTKEVTMQECSITSQPRCEPTTRTVCRDVTSKVEVCNDVPEEECEHQQTPGTRTMRTAPAPPSGNVFQPRDRSAIQWWSRCPGKLMRPSVPQSTWRSAPLIMVIDICFSSLFSYECSF